jgi:hypothetical protein
MINIDYKKVTVSQILLIFNLLFSFLALYFWIYFVMYHKHIWIAMIFNVGQLICIQLDKHKLKIYLYFKGLQTKKKRLKEINDLDKKIRKKRFETIQTSFFYIYYKKRINNVIKREKCSYYRR